MVDWRKGGRKCNLSALHSTNNTGRRLDEAKQREIFDACAQGESVAAVGRRFHVSRPTVYRIIERFTPGPSTVREDCRITVRLSREELGELDALAEQHKVSRSELTRKIVRLAAGFLAPDDDWSEAARDLTRQVKGIGGNLNQIAFHMNRDARETGNPIRHHTMDDRQGSRSEPFSRRSAHWLGSCKDWSTTRRQG